MKIMQMKRAANFQPLYRFCPHFSRTKKPLVHHMTLFECSTSQYPSSNPMSWDIWVKSNGDVCNSNLLTPRDWDACITPVAVWTIGSTGTPCLSGTYTIWALFNATHAKHGRPRHKPPSLPPATFNRNSCKSPFQVNIYRITLAFRSAAALVSSFTCSRSITTIQRLTEVIVTCNT